LIANFRLTVLVCDFLFGLGNIEALKAGTQRAGCTDRVFLKTPLPLIPSITPNGANTASTIVWQRYACAQIGLDSPKKESWAYNGVLTGSDSRAFVLANIAEITITLAQYADSLGLEPAKVGITEVDPRIARKFPTVTVVILGALALAAAVMYGRSR